MSKTHRPERLRFGQCNDGHQVPCHEMYLVTMGVHQGEVAVCECECHEGATA